MALRTPLSVTPHLYMGDSTGRPLDNGVVYFGEQDKDPEYYPINLFSDDALTLPLAQPVHTKGGYLYDKGDMVEPHAKELIYSVKVLDSYGRKVFYKGAMMRNSWNDDVIGQINEALLDSKRQAAEVAGVVVREYLDELVIDADVINDGLIKTLPNNGGVARVQRDKNADIVNIMDFQRRSDRDFTDAFEAAINSQPTKNGFVINVPSGVFKLTRPIFITGSIEIKGEGMGNTVLDFSEATSKLNAPYSCAIMFPYYSNIAGSEYTTVPDPVVMPPIYTNRGGINGKLTNLTVLGKGKTHSDADFNGVFINTPSNLDKVEVKEFSGHGFVLAGNVSDSGYGGGYTYGGNANHTQLAYCQAFLNGKDGLRIIGSDANTFVINQCLFPSNGGWGIFDHSLLGGMVMGCEADGNGKGSYGGSGYDSVPVTPSRTLWLGNYSEGGSTPVHYAVNSRNTIIGGTGGTAGSGQPALLPITDAGMFLDRGIAVASDERMAIDLGGTTERASRLLKGKLEMRTGINRDIFSMGTGYTDDYIEFLVGNVNGITIPTTNITDSLLKGVPWFPLGMTLSQTCHVTAADAAPTTGYHRQGEYVYNARPTAGSFAGWVCVASGSSGVWKGFGAIEA